MKTFTRITVILLCAVLLGSIPASAASAAYTTYIYVPAGTGANSSIGVDSPDAYVPERIITSAIIGLTVPLDGPSDLFVDPTDNKVYIADPKNNRIVVMSPDYRLDFTITQFVNIWGVPDALSGCKGVYADEKSIYVADTEKNRIVVFDKEGNHQRIIEQPENEVFPEGAVYKPIALVVDKSGRFYVVSSTTNQGIITMSSAGEFQGFIGAQAAVVDAFTIFWRSFQTKEQRAQSIRNVATEYNNISIDSEGFVYVTTSSISPSQQQAALMDRSGTYAPVKRLNPQGSDVLRRSGHVGPGGEVFAFMFTGGGAGRMRGPSKIIDVALGPEGTWSIIDENRGKVYTYDEDGKMLFIFGDEGLYFGNMQSIQAIAYQGDKIILLDKNTNNFTTYKRTPYGDVLIEALASNRNREYDKSVEYWKEILKRNINFNLSYVGIGKSFHRDGAYLEAMEQFKLAWDTKNYSNSFKQYRKLWIENYVVVIPLSVLVLVILLSQFFKWVGKVNTRDQIRDGRKLKLKSHMIYGFYIIFHPFDGFWDMKHEKRGSVLAATIYLLLTCLSFIFMGIGRGYIINPFSYGRDFIAESIAIIIPVILFVISNWCLTTLFEGEGSMKDVYMVTCYSLIPLIPVTIAYTLLTHVMVLEELPLLLMIHNLAYTWMGLLLFFGVMVVHDYSLGKNVATMIGSIVGMAFIMFIAVLFSSLLFKIVSFIQAIYIEMSYRF